jgi:3-oxoacyl-[acyl-carrier-protein] synthase-3
VTSGKKIVKYAAIGPIATHFPDRIETNDELKAAFPDWDLEAIATKTGIQKRHIAASNECSSDLGVEAARKLFHLNEIDPQTIDFLLFCTQTPDYSLPTTACLMQDRLGLRTNIGAMDFNLGCSGFVYGLAVADGLIRSATAGRVLLITAETYSKLIHPTDRSLRTIFGDAAVATLIEPHSEPSMWGCQYGTDGSGADTLLAHGGGFRAPCDSIKPRHRKRWPSDLYMDGPSLMSFTIGKIPETVDAILERAQMTRDQIDFYLFHQATFKLLDQLRVALAVDEKRLPIRIEDIGNTVSCTLPILISQMRASGELQKRHKNLLIGFGVGWSWAGCVWQDKLSPRVR